MMSFEELNRILEDDRKRRRRDNIVQIIIILVSVGILGVVASRLYEYYHAIAIHVGLK